MKKILSLVLVALMVASLCACGTNTETTPGPNPGTTPAPTTTANKTPDGPAVINVNEYLADLANWEIDDDFCLQHENGKMSFKCTTPGESMAAMLKVPAKNVTYKFTLTVDALGDDVVGAENWWDAELLFLARASVAGPGWRDDGSQTGYSITSWGEMKKVCIGRAGKDDLAEFDWNIADGQPHDIEFSVVSNEDDTVVTITLKVDGVVIGSVEDDGSEIKNDRPGSYPNEGNLVIRAKWVGITVG